MELIDTHAHLDMLDNLEVILNKARIAGIIKIITISVNLATIRKAVILAKTYQGVFYSVGLHPHYASHANEALWLEMEVFIRSGAVAVGECGLDFFRNFSSRAIQRKAFAKQIELANRFKLPLIVHSRDAHAETIAMLQEQDGGQWGGVLHCFSGDQNFAKQILRLGFMIGISGTITYPKNDILHTLLGKVPLNRLVIETDCPYLAPVPYRGKKNEPTYLVHTNKKLAQILNIDEEKCADLTTSNAHQLYKLPTRNFIIS